MNKLIRKLLDVVGIVGFIVLLTYLYRGYLEGTFIGDIWDGILRNFSQGG